MEQEEAAEERPRRKVSRRREPEELAISGDKELIEASRADYLADLGSLPHPTEDIPFVDRLRMMREADEPPISQARRRSSRREQEVEARKASDPIAQAVGRDDIDYGSDELPTAPRVDRGTGAL